MDLIVDIGNTRTHLALFDGERLVAHGAVANADPDREDGWASFVGDLPITRAALAHVNAPVAHAFGAWTRKRFGQEARVLGDTLPCAIPLEVDEPGRVGADRVANAIWATRTHPGKAMVVVDLGTAITFDVVSSDGAFVGGVIAAGIDTCARALANQTAQLPLISLREHATERPFLTCVGKTTQACLEGGLLWGAVGLVETVVARIAIELGEEPVAVATGGDAELVAKHCPRLVQVVPDLTLTGIRLALAEADG